MSKTFRLFCGLWLAMILALEAWGQYPYSNLHMARSFDVSLLMSGVALIFSVLISFNVAWFAYVGFIFLQFLFLLKISSHLDSKENRNFFLALFVPIVLGTVLMNKFLLPYFREF